MTLIVTVNTPYLSLLLGDARVTSTPRDGASLHVDCCQKVFRLSHSTLVAFAGDVNTAAEFLKVAAAVYQLKGEEHHNQAFSIQQLVLTHTLQQSSIADAWRLKDGTLPHIDFVFTGRAKPDVPIFQSLHFRLPDGHVELLTQKGITVLGSGKPFFMPIAKMLEDSLDDFCKEAATEADPPHYLAWKISTFVLSTLQIMAMRAAEKR